MRLIEADVLLDAISVHLERIEQEVNDAPAVEPSLTADELISILKDYRLKSGKWIAKERGHGWDCSECGYELWTYGSRNYCPNCGSKNEEEQR